MARTFSVENSDALTDSLRGLDSIASESVLRQAAVAGARVIFNEVKLRASGLGGGPQVGTGNLRDSILMAFDKEASVEGKLASYIVTWSKEAFYGRFLEFGTSKMAARPFLRPGYEAKKQAAAAAVDTVIQAKVKEVTNG